jgi:DNA-directed RNA polymerase subunit RPC12/RpoP
VLPRLEPVKAITPTAVSRFVHRQSADIQLYTRLILCRLWSIRLPRLVPLRSAIVISFNCPTCSKSFKVADDKAGKSTKCPECQEPLVVPSLDQEWWRDAPSTQGPPPRAVIVRRGIPPVYFVAGIALTFSILLGIGVVWVVSKRHTPEREQITGSDDSGASVGVPGIPGLVPEDYFSDEKVAARLNESLKKRNLSLKRFEFLENQPPKTTLLETRWWEPTELEARTDEPKIVGRNTPPKRMYYITLNGVSNWRTHSAALLLHVVGTGKYRLDRALIDYMPEKVVAASYCARVDFQGYEPTDILIKTPGSFIKDEREIEQVKKWAKEISESVREATR